MDRREAILRELNLYPQWRRRELPGSITTGDLPAQDAVVQPDPSASITTRDSAEARKVEMPVVPVEQREPKKNETPEKDKEAPAVSQVSDAEGLDWPQLKQRVKACTICKLRAGCTQTVLGMGDESADWLFVGEGPGADEDALGEPFVGQAGKLLDNMLLSIKLKRGNNVYIANIVKCRPPGNRNPEADEIASCLPYLQRQIELIRPKVIIALGKVASNALLGRDATLASLRGKSHDYRGTPLIVTYHPAYLLRSPSEKAKAWQDLCLAVQMTDGKIN
ncbi:MAG: uracil-DNA glycosylase [Gallionella sp.]